MSVSNSLASSARSKWEEFKPRSLPPVPSWVEPLGRAGYIAKGIVYGIIGFLAFKLAIGAGGEIAGSREAIQTIGQQPYGRILLGIVALSLLGYTVWRLVQAVKDTEGAGTDLRGVGQRLGYVISGLTYLALGGFAGSIALGMGGQSNSGNSASFLLDSTWGRLVLGVVGVITIGVAMLFISKGIKAKFMENYALSSMSDTQRKIAYYAGRVGLSTRGVAFAIIGGFILMSAWRGTAGGEIAGLKDALAAIAAQAYGKVLIGITGLGLICYAVHMVMTGIYRSFNVGK